ncbi:MAG TPA: DHHA1 domain-containing protein, partial [Candidatus Dormibacteraeota bacterium]|nr:DHHA1 domain-containing protein [Candidatus Dormibacteraeota bacterium]
RALAALAGCPTGPTSTDLAFAIAPRINAAGRMEDAGIALACCLADDATAGGRAAAELQALNQRRRTSLQAAMGVAGSAVDALDDGAAVVALGDPTFAPGVVGLVAGRLVERFGRPAFVHSETGDEWRGSARGVRGLNVVEVLEACAPTLRRFGGHAAAGGYSLDPTPVAAAAFRARLLEVVAAAGLAGPPERTFPVDAVCVLGDCTLDLADELAGLEPVGTGNPPALLAALDCRVEGTTAFGAAGDHLRLDLRDATGRAQAVTFNRPHLRPHLPVGRRIDCLFGLEADEWRGRRRVRLLLRDVRPHRPAA